MPSPHPLDRPIWAALTGLQAEYALGDGRAWRFDPDYAAFAAAADRSAESLAAMAGERLRTLGFTEVSGVCTHPDFRRLGLAAGLMRIVAAGILARGETPFLHTYASNTGAIALYETLGFRLRSEMTMMELVRR